jgi:hypothetical protein
MPSATINLKTLIHKVQRKLIFVFAALAYESNPLKNWGTGAATLGCQRSLQLFEFFDESDFDSNGGHLFLAHFSKVLH